MAFEHHHCYNAAADVEECSWSCSAVLGNVLYSFGRSFSVLQEEGEVRVFRFLPSNKECILLPHSECSVGPPALHLFPQIRVSFMNFTTTHGFSHCPPCSLQMQCYTNQICNIPSCLQGLSIKQHSRALNLE